MTDMSFIPEYWKLKQFMVLGQIRDKVRKVCSGQIWFRGRLNPFLGGLGSDYLGVAINHDRDMVETGDMILVYNTE